MTTPYADPQSTHTPATGASPPAAWGQTVRDDLQFLNQWVGCFVQRGPGTYLNDDITSRAYIQWDGTDLWDSDNFHNPASNNSRLTIPAGLGGKYMVGARLITSAPANTNQRDWQAFVRVNGSTEFFVNGGHMTPLANGRAWVITVDFPVVLNAGDYVEIGAAQSTIVPGTSGQYIDYGYGWLRYMGA